MHRVAGRLVPVVCWLSARRPSVVVTLSGAGAGAVRARALDVPPMSGSSPSRLAGIGRGSVALRVMAAPPYRYRHERARAVLLASSSVVCVVRVTAGDRGRPRSAVVECSACGVVAWCVASVVCAVCSSSRGPVDAYSRAAAWRAGSVAPVVTVGDRRRVRVGRGPCGSTRSVDGSATRLPAEHGRRVFVRMGTIAECGRRGRDRAPAGVDAAACRYAAARGRGDVGRRARTVARTLGEPLNAWQRHVGDVSLELEARARRGRRLRRFAARYAGVVVPRQCGKSYLARTRAVLQCVLAELDLERVARRARRRATRRLVVSGPG